MTFSLGGDVRQESTTLVGGGSIPADNRSICLWCREGNKLSGLGRTMGTVHSTLRHSLPSETDALKVPNACTACNAERSTK